MAYHDNPEYQRSEFDVGPKVQPPTKPSRRLKLPKPNYNKLLDIAKDGAVVVAGTTWISLPLWIVLGASLLFVDQDKDNNHYKPFMLPSGAREIKQSDTKSREFVFDSQEVGQIACGSLNIGYSGTTYSKMMPVEEELKPLGEDTVLIIKNGHAQNSTSYDSILSCTYPNSDPSEILHIPIRRAGE